MAKDIVTKAEILGGEIDVRANFGQTVKVTVSPDPYMGDTEVTPSAETQVLATKKKFVQDDITVYPAPTEVLSTTSNGTFTPSEGKVGFSAVTVDVNPDLRPLSVSENGTYQPDGFDGYSDVTVDVYPTEYSDDIDDFSGGNIRALISHAQEYINTGYYPNIDVEMRLKIANNAYSNQYGGLCCVAYSTSRIGCQFYSSNYEKAQFLTTINLSYADVVNIDNPFWIRSLIPYQTQEQANRPLIIFYVYRNAGYDRKSGMTFYGLKCYENRKLVKKYVPWLDENNVPCVHELIDNEYFYNVGTGNFGYIDLEGNEH